MIRIVFVEDDPVVMSNLRRVLSVMRREWDMRFFASGEEALMHMSEKPFDVVVSDLSMPGMTGMELLSLVQYQYPRVVRVLLSEPSEAQGVVRGAGVAHRIMRKPCDPAELSMAVQRAFELEQRLCDPDLQSMISEVGTLPSPSSIVTELNDLLGRDDSTVSEVAAVVGSDVGMTAKLLQVVNSAYFGLSHPMTDVREAIAYLGLDTVRNLTVAMKMLECFDSGPALVRSAIEEIHDHSLAVAHVARELIVDRNQANQAFVAALLHDVGLLLVASEMPERFLELRVQTMRCSLPLTELETEILGAHHADIGAHLLDLWGLPYEIVEAVARHHDAVDVPATKIDAVHAVHIADAIVNKCEDADDSEWDGECDALEPSYLERLGVAERVLRMTSSTSAV